MTNKETGLMYLIALIIYAIWYLLSPTEAERKAKRRLKMKKNRFIIDPSLSKEEKLRMTEEFIEKEDYTKAIKLCNNIIKKDKSCAIVYCFKAEAMNYGPMKSRTAIKLATKAIELDPNLARAYYIRAISRNWDYAGNTEKLEMEDFNKAIELDPNFSEAYLNRGRLKTDNGDIEGAIEDFNSAIETNPNNDEAYYERGNIKNDRKDFYGAIADYEKALLINPKDSFAKTKRTLCLFKTGQTLKGILSIFGK